MQLNVVSDTVQCRVRGERERGEGGGKGRGAERKGERHNER